jgi:hypothetical protein
MNEKVVPFTKPIIRVPARWRKHADALRQMQLEIDALRVRLNRELRDFTDVMREDMDISDGRRAFLPEGEQKAMALAAWHLDKNVRDAQALLECANERIGYATPDDWEFQFERPKSGPAA